ncbi:NTP pyrophosphohydrolase [Gordonia sihwensis]|uniref:NUDIX hydrolase n=1 Tax=Gordonia TaxID=2053 RepID=UPI00078454F6|nr:MULTISPECIES: NUDIX domain-containing protein [Gordonia]KXT56573.1 NTP pyrophosphohydrolase [Gordonia sp. QH-12]MBY4571797.1 NTP pyrophosphohydrolase [Gordonia sihwensis]
MPTPEYVLKLREHIGHDPLVLIGVTAVILREDANEVRVLLGRRSDNGALAPITGIVDPGEEPATAARREALEEAGVDIEVERLAWVHQLPRRTHVNGDQVDYLDLTFRCRWRSGDPVPSDGEMTEVMWRRLDDLDDLGSDDLRKRIELAVSGTGATAFGGAESASVERGGGGREVE